MVILLIDLSQGKHTSMLIHNVSLFYVSARCISAVNFLSRKVLTNAILGDSYRDDAQACLAALFLTDPRDDREKLLNIRAQESTVHAYGSRTTRFIIHGFAPIRNYYGYPVAPVKAKPCSRSSSLKSSSKPRSIHKTHYSCNTSVTIRTKSVIQLWSLSED